jgi:hypothetical protein
LEKSLHKKDLARHEIWGLEIKPKKGKDSEVSGNKDIGCFFLCIAAQTQQFGWKKKAAKLAACQHVEREGVEVHTFLCSHFRLAQT